MVHDLTLEVQSGGWRPKQTTLLSNISFEVDKGQSLSVSGRSGIGKSTLAKALMGLHSHCRGQIKVGEHNVLTLSKRQRRSLHRCMQLVLQNTAALNAYFPVGHSVTEPLQNFGIDREKWDERIETALKHVRLEPSLLERYPDQLSGGQRQRFAIARSLVLQPQVVILDEPVSNLDRPVQVGLLDDLLAWQAASNRTFLLITHDVRVAKYFCDQTLLIQDQHVELISTLDLD